VKSRNSLYHCPGISEIQLFGIPDVKFGEEIAAFVKLKKGATTTPEDIVWSQTRDLFTTAVPTKFFRIRFID
jgi:acyl-CoA synthetase (AMP-forming)/AMP-acid ligase II